VQLPHTGYWHVEIYVPNWTQYGQQDVYVSSSADAVSETVIDDQAEFGRWVMSAFGSHRYDEGADYTVQLVPGHDFHCFYEPADKVRWVYDGPSSPSATIAEPQSGGSYPQGALVRTRFICMEAYDEPLESCTDSNGVSGGEGILDTSTLGEREYTVIAKGAGGATGSAKITYTVLPAKVSCASDQAKITLSPGLSDQPAVQTVKVKGTLTGCSPGTFTSAMYSANLKTSSPVACSVLHEDTDGTGTVSLKWAPKVRESKSVGSFTLPVGETPESELGGTLESGPFSPASLYGRVSEAFTGAAGCGMSVKGKVKPVKKATLVGTRFVAY
jgi:hypothetical protein